jgi:hypothetical protein
MGCRETDVLAPAAWKACLQPQQLADLWLAAVRYNLPAAFHHPSLNAHPEALWRCGFARIGTVCVAWCCMSSLSLSHPPCRQGAADPRQLPLCTHPSHCAAAAGINDACCGARLRSLQRSQLWPHPATPCGQLRAGRQQRSVPCTPEGDLHISWPGVVAATSCNLLASPGFQTVVHRTEQPRATHLR